MSEPAIDLSQLSAQDRAYYNRFGRLPPPAESLLVRGSREENQRFDSADRAMASAGRRDVATPGSNASPLHGVLRGRRTAGGPGPSALATAALPADDDEAEDGDDATSDDADDSGNANASGIDLDSLAEEDRSFYERFGKLPPTSRDLLEKEASDNQRFDSADRAMAASNNHSDLYLGASASPILTANEINFNDAEAPPSSALAAAAAAATATAPGEPLPEVDLSRLSDEDRAFYDQYGKLPSNARALLVHNEKPSTRFDSADRQMKDANASGDLYLGADGEPVLAPRDLRSSGSTDGGEGGSSSRAVPPEESLTAHEREHLAKFGRLPPPSRVVLEGHVPEPRFDSGDRQMEAAGVHTDLNLGADGKPVLGPASRRR